MTCWKIIQKAGPNVLAAFIQIGNIVYPPEEADNMRVFKIVRICLLSSAGQQNVTNLHLQMFKKNECAPEKLPSTRESLYTLNALAILTTQKRQNKRSCQLVCPLQCS